MTQELEVEEQRGRYSHGTTEQHRAATSSWLMALTLCTVAPGFPQANLPMSK